MPVQFRATKKSPCGDLFGGLGRNVRTPCGDVAKRNLTHYAFGFVPGGHLCPAQIPTYTRTDAGSIPGHKKIPMRGFIWRPGSESNRHTRICSPLHNHSATRP